MTFSSKRKSQEAQSISSDTTVKSHFSQRSQQSHSNSLLEIVETQKIIEIISKIQALSRDVQFEGDGREKYISFLKNYKSLVQQFNVIIVDPNEIFEDFWQRWNQFAELIDSVLPADNFQNVIDFSSEQLQRTQQCFKKAKTRMIKIKPKSEEKFDYIIGTIDDLVKYIFSIKKPSSIKKLQTRLNELNSSITTYVTPYYKQIMKITDNKQMTSIDPNIQSSFQYYKSACSFFKQILPLVKTFNESSETKNQFISTIEFYGRELSVLVPESLKTITISQIEEKRRKLINKEKEAKRSIRGSYSLTSVSTISPTNDNTSVSTISSTKDINTDAVSLDQETTKVPIRRRIRPKLDSISPSITPKGLRTQRASQFVKKDVKPSTIDNKSKKKHLPRDSSSEVDYDIDDNDKYLSDSSSDNERKHSRHKINAKNMLDKSKEDSRKEKIKQLLDLSDSEDDNEAMPKKKFKQKAPPKSSDSE